jgi:hypothetical protein
VAGGIQGRAEPVRVRRADPGADARLGAQCGEGRGSEQPPVGQNEHVIGDQLNLAQRMAGQQHRATFVRESTHVPAQPPHARRVEAVCRLVQDENRGVAEHRRGQPQPLPHSEGELPYPPPRVFGQPGLGQGPPGRVLRQPRRRRQDAQVVERAPPGVVAGRLEHRADPTNRVCQLAVPPAVKCRGSPVGCHQPEQHPQGRGLACPVGSKQGRYLAR